MNWKSVAFIGAGRVTRLLLEGFRKAGVSFSPLLASDIKPEPLQKLKEIFPAIEISLNDNRPAASADLVFLALHPPALLEVLKEIKSSLPPASILISLAPKITISKIMDMLDGFSRMARIIPNASSVVNSGYNPVVFGPGLSQQERDELRSLFSVLGECPEVGEELLEAYAILTAMGPTYFWFQWEELVNIGESFGLGHGEAKKALHQMIVGAAKTLFTSNLTSEEIMDLIPLRPLAEEEATLKKIYQNRLKNLYEKLKP